MEKFLVELHELLAAEDDFSTKIMGGDPAKIHEFPFHVSLTWSPDRDYFCGGVLITPKHVLTAAHCVITDYGWHMEPENIIIIAGRNFLNETGEIRYPKVITPHENYTIPTKQNDIAIIELKTPYEFSNKVSTIPLINYRVRPLTKCTAIGFGSPSPSGPPTSNQLMKVDVPVQSMFRCRLLFAKRVQIFDGMMCAGYFTGKRDACSGDSGGPFVCDSQLGGIISAGISCGVLYNPGIYSDTVYFRPFIDSVLAASNTTLPINNFIEPSSAVTNTLDTRNKINFNVDNTHENGEKLTTLSNLFSKNEESIDFPNQFIYDNIMIPEKKSITSIIQISEGKLPLLPINDILPTPLDHQNDIEKTTYSADLNINIMTNEKSSTENYSYINSVNDSLLLVNTEKNFYKDNFTHKINNENQSNNENAGFLLTNSTIFSLEESISPTRSHFEENIVTSLLETSTMTNDLSIIEEYIFSQQPQLSTKSTSQTENSFSIEQSLIVSKNEIALTEENFKSNSAIPMSTQIEENLQTSNFPLSSTPISPKMNMTENNLDVSNNEMSVMEENLIISNSQQTLMPLTVVSENFKSNSPTPMSTQTEENPQTLNFPISSTSASPKIYIAENNLDKSNKDINVMEENLIISNSQQILIPFTVDSENFKFNSEIPTQTEENLHISKLPQSSTPISIDIIDNNLDESNNEMNAMEGSLIISNSQQTLMPLSSVSDEYLVNLPQFITSATNAHEIGIAYTDESLITLNDVTVENFIATKPQQSLMTTTENKIITQHLEISTKRNEINEVRQSEISLIENQIHINPTTVVTTHETTRNGSTSCLLSTIIWNISIIKLLFIDIILGYLATKY